MTTALGGLRVLDQTQVMAGPFCSMLLADMGADVVKIEPPGGEHTRRETEIAPGVSASFLAVNRNKRSLVLDLKRPEGVAVLKRLVATADVLVENYRPGVAKRLGVDYETLSAINPRLIYCSISGFGQTGPWRSRPAFAHIINAISGLMHLEQGEAPTPHSSNLQAADVLAGTHASMAILAALLRRGRTGRGAYLDVSMLEALVAADSVTYAAVLNGGEEHGSPRPGMIVAPVGDRHVAMQFVGAEQLWPRLLGVMQRPALDQDPRFDTSDKRRRNWRELRPIVEGWLATFPTSDAALRALAGARIPCAPVLRPAEVVASAHLAERRFFPAVPHPGSGTVRVTASPYHLDGAPVHPRGGAPYRVGEHTRAVLGDLLQYPAERVEALLAAGVIGGPPPGDMPAG